MRWTPLIIAAVLAGCSDREVASTTKVETVVVKPIDRPIPSPFSILDAVIEGDSLRVEVQFGGGFRAHTFTLSSDGAATKSLPRQQPLRLVHDSHGDMGRALITEGRAFDLTPFRDPSQPMVRLALQGWSGLLDYRYSD
jgi:hypothetical protein